MANHKSALKKMRQDRARRDRNRAHRSRLRNGIKKMRTLLAAGDAKGAAELLPSTHALLDRATKQRIVQPNAAARTKSRLAAALNKLTAGS